ncbi:hypothetical protein [Streptomyces sp. NBC_01264]|uniref:hypothetical protein n=1 Tax=Streptomyces sp. NBC_01264 TaxID=2903804 RepID=UPI00225A7374|nr:hypothetical protein [Streptomyces sp. NBC_01264]MCX4784240.1 hypothetical protein [Streptomyces sp. NBC_01264]
MKAKVMPVDAARSLGKLARDLGWSSAEQLVWWWGEQEQLTAAFAERSAVRKAAKAPAAKRPERVAAVPGQAHPGDDTSEAEGLTPPKLTMFPYTDGAEAAGHLIRKMPSTEFAKMLAVLNRHAESQEAVPAG